MKAVTPILVASDQESGAGKTRIVEDLKRENVPALPSGDLPIDLMWSVDGVMTAWDLKKPSDFIASHGDGRLFNQITAMQEMGCREYGFIIQDFPRGVLVGEGGHEWTFEAFDEALFSVQRAGCKILHAETSRLAKRVAELYRYMAKDEAGSWVWPVPIYPANDFKGDGPIFFDKTFRSHVGVVMHTAGYGPKISNTLLEKFTFMDVMGITEEGLANSIKLRSSVKGIGPKLITAWEQYARA